MRVKDSAAVVKHNEHKICSLTIYDERSLWYYTHKLNIKFVV